MTIEAKARRLALPSFTLTQTCGVNDPGAIKRIIPTSNGEVTYYYRQISVPVVGSYSYNNFQIVVDHRGAPWREACLYILSRLEGSIGRSGMKTFIVIGGDIAEFKKFIDEEHIDYTVFPRRKQARPTYRYRGCLMVKTHSGEIAPTTARRRMQSVVGFYRWLVREGWFVPENPLWDEKDAYIHFTGTIGQRLTKVVKTTDVSVKVARQDDPYDGMIMDGGKLKPLPIVEQEKLAETLLEIGNTEMTLAHLVALFTGSRMQTVLTIKVRHVRVELPESAMEVPLICGPSSGIDTKYGKSQTLHFPRWLYEQVRIYSYSDRATARRKKSTRSDSDDAYLFLSSQGNPYYQDTSETQRFDKTRTTRYEANGGAIRVFIADRVLPEMRKKVGKHFHYQFHDLRASFGMNLTDTQLKRVEKGEITLHDAREFVKTRMCHESTATTDKYLQYRQKNKMVEQVQRHYEEHLRNLIETTKNGLLHSDRDVK